MDKGLCAEPVVVAELQRTVAQLTHSALEHGQDIECVGGALDSNSELILYLDRQPADMKYSVDTWPMHAPEFCSEGRFSVVDLLDPEALKHEDGHWSMISRSIE